MNKINQLRGGGAGKPYLNGLVYLFFDNGYTSVHFERVCFFMCKKGEK